MLFTELNNKESSSRVDLFPCIYSAHQTDYSKCYFLIAVLHSKSILLALQGYNLFLCIHTLVLCIYSSYFWCFRLNQCMYYLIKIHLMDSPFSYSHTCILLLNCEGIDICMWYCYVFLPKDLPLLSSMLPSHPCMGEACTQMYSLSRRVVRGKNTSSGMCEWYD